MNGNLPHMTKPCASCPWKCESVVDDIPRFSMELAEDLASTCPDRRNMGPDGGASIFACHQSKDEAEFACAGWLAQVGHRHPGVRSAVASGRLDPRVLSPGLDWPMLHDDYEQVLRKLRMTCRTS